MNLLNKYVWLLDVIKRSGECGILFSKIAEHWSNEFGEELSKRTFHHQKSRIEELFGVNIVCDRVTNLYSIECAETLEGDGLRNWILNSFTLSNTLLGALSVRDRIVNENQPSSALYLQPIIEALKTNKIVEMVYKSFKYENNVTIILMPYFVKQYKNRWYLYGVAKEDKKLKLYALDRVISLSVTEDKFDLPKDFYPLDILHTAFGVTLYDNIPPTTITLRAYHDKYKYIDTLPLHHSQRKVDICKEYTTYELYIAPTPEFFNEILSQGADLEVISPTKVREDLIIRVNNIKSRYV